MKDGKNEFTIPLKPIQEERRKSNVNSNNDSTIQAREKLLIVCLTCFVFMGIEFVGGIWASSLAIMTDAAHLLSDLAGFVISILALQFAKSSADTTYTFGYYRAEIVGAFISVMIIWVLTILLLAESIQRLFEVHHEIDGKIMLITASIGLCFNLIMVYILHSDVN